MKAEANHASIETCRFRMLVKIDPSQNQDLSTSLDRSHKELLNELISFEIRHS